MKNKIDDLLQIHFTIFDELLKSENNGKITVNIEKQIIEIKEKLKNTFNQNSIHYTHACHYLDKEFENYINNKR